MHMQFLLGPSLKIMSILAHSQSPLLSPDANPLLRFFLKNTFYRQFCAGENASEVRHTINTLKSRGFKGVILGYAREVVLDEKQTNNLESCGEYEIAEACIRNEITPWAKGTLETVRLAGPDDFVALKFTGAGSQALYDLSRQADPSPALREAIDSVCDLAAERGVRLLFDAEQHAVQAGIDAWTLEYMKKYNGTKSGKAVVYGTYQAYLKATPSVLAGHLDAARKGNFTLGVKLVRGAYLGSDPRHLIHDTKAATDDAYNSIAESLARRSYGPVLKATETGSEFPSVNVVLAGHNQASVRRIQALRTSQAQLGEPQTNLVYAQLQGMADEVSCELVQAGQVQESENANVDIPKAYKYLVWGTTGECMKYLLRRAQENRDAVQRTKAGRDAMAAELWRRVKSGLGLA
jgi:proline dehydrogenase